MPRRSSKVAPEQQQKVASTASAASKSAKKPDVPTTQIPVPDNATAASNGAKPAKKPGMLSSLMSNPFRRKFGCDDVEDFNGVMLAEGEARGFAEAGVFLNDQDALEPEKMDSEQSSRASQGVRTASRTGTMCGMEYPWERDALDALAGSRRDALHKALDQADGQVIPARAGRASSSSRSDGLEVRPGASFIAVTVPLGDAEAGRRVVERLAERMLEMPLMVILLDSEGLHTPSAHQLKLQETKAFLRLKAHGVYWQSNCNEKVQETFDYWLLCAQEAWKAERRAQQREMNRQFAEEECALELVWAQAHKRLGNIPELSVELDEPKVGAVWNGSHAIVERLGAGFYGEVLLAVNENTQEQSAMKVEIAGALAYIHGRGVAHCDVKPENIVVADSAELVKLVDFGEARNISAACEMHGTMPFMAPELIRQDAETYNAAKADVWALGVVLVEMLCGLNYLPKTLKWEKPWGEARPSRAEDMARFASDWGRATLGMLLEVPFGAWNPQLNAMLKGMLAASSNERSDMSAVAGATW